MPRGRTTSGNRLFLPVLKSGFIHPNVFSIPKHTWRVSFLRWHRGLESRHLSRKSMLFSRFYTNHRVVVCFESNKDRTQQFQRFVFQCISLLYKPLGWVVLKTQPNGFLKPNPTGLLKPNQFIKTQPNRGSPQQPLVSPYLGLFFWAPSPSPPSRPAPPQNKSNQTNTPPAGFFGFKPRSSPVPVARRAP